ncbi:hypothetical protein CP980_09800 [Streptomyces vinaceus]|uniref:Uncharacterized protein n=1 Tax=Streptomyces vinaceus TaxID=1960 RepID=A0A5J6J4A8_STRVI|nr:hypothetical protein CP980_09800 [Streptomyces vinaceus]
MSGSGFPPRGEGAATAPIIARGPLPAGVEPGNEKTPRGCERSARGSGARWPPARRFSTVQRPLRTGALLSIIMS